MILPLEIMREVISLITCGKTYKQILFASKSIYANNLYRRDKMCNHLWTLIKAQPDKGWEWGNILKNPNTKMEHIELIKNRKVLTFCGADIVENANFTLDFIERFMPAVDYELHRCTGWKLFDNPHLTFEYLENYIETLKNNSNLTDGTKKRYIRGILDAAVDNPGIKIEDIEDTMLEYEWNWEYAMANPNITEKFVEDNIELLKQYSFYQLSKNRAISMEYIESHCDYPWCWPAVALNPNLTIDFIKKYPKTPAGNWIWSNIFRGSIPTNDLDNYLSQLSPLELEEIMMWMGTDIVELEYMSHVSIPRFYRKEFLVTDILKTDSRYMAIASKSPNITMEDVKNHPEVLWSYSQLSCNQNLTFRFVLDNPLIEWSYISISANTFGL